MQFSIILQNNWPQNAVADQSEWNIPERGVNSALINFVLKMKLSKGFHGEYFFWYFTSLLFFSPYLSETADVWLEANLAVTTIYTYSWLCCCL